MTAAYAKSAVKLLCATSLLALAGQAIAQPGGTTGAAQGADDASGLQEIVVTAQKRAENLQDVPIAVTAVTGETVSALHATSLRELQGTVPGVQLGSFANNKQSAVFTIRGIGVIEPDPYAGNTVSIVYDGVPQFFNYGALLDLFDIERVEVLRGPQGTLFGANTTGGVVNVVTAQPTGEFGGHAEVTYGNHNRIDVGVALDFPITESLSGKVTAFHTGNDGWIKNVADPDSPIDKRDRNILRGYLKYAPNADFDATLIGEYARIRDGAGYVVNGAAPGEPIAPPAPRSYPAFCPPSRTEHCHAPDEFVSGRNRNVPDVSDMDSHRLTFTVNLRNTPIGDITSITGYRGFDFLEWVDQDGTEALLSASRRYSDGWQFSQELRTAADVTDRLNILVGGFYLRDYYQQDQEVHYGFSLPGFVQITPHEQKNWSASAFAQAYYDVTDQLQLLAGIRYSHEYTKLTTQVINTFDPDGDPTQWSGGKGLDVQIPDGAIEVPGSIAPVTGKKSWDNVGWKLGVNYKVTDEHLLYASWARGFKSGGFVGRIGLPQDIGPYEPEEVDSYELGFKGQFADRRLQVNLSLFYTDYTDMQLAQTISFEDPVTHLQVNSSSIINAPGAIIKGVELELAARPVSGLTLGGSLSYLDTKYKNFHFNIPDSGDTDPGTPGVQLEQVNLKGERLMNAPKWTASANIAYEFPLAGGTGTARADYSYTSSKYQNIWLPPRSWLQPTHLVGGSFDWEPEGEKWSIGAWIRNAFNEHYLTSIFQDRGYGAIAQYVRPREFGGTVRVKW